MVVREVSEPEGRGVFPSQGLASPGGGGDLGRRSGLHPLVLAMVMANLFVLHCALLLVLQAKMAKENPLFW